MTGDEMRMPCARCGAMTPTYNGVVISHVADTPVTENPMSRIPRKCDGSNRPPRIDP